VIDMVVAPGEIDYIVTPERTMEFAKFLKSIGGIENMPESWKDLYWENNHDLSGS
jgi:hypothetical protein